MARFAILLLSFAMASGPFLIAADGTLAAEGDYVARTKTGDKLLSHWQLWHLSNGEYQVIDTSVKNASSVQIFQFDSQFLPIGYTKKFGPTSLPQIPNVPAISGRTLPGHTISCQYGRVELRCVNESSEGHRSTTAISATPPYVFIGEFYDLDFAWFMTAVVRLVSPNEAKNGVVNVYALTNGSKVSDISLKPDKPIKIDLIGDEKIQAMGKTQAVTKYQWGARELLVTTQGLVVSMGSDQIVYAISGYKEYESWGVIR